MLEQSVSGDTQPQESVVEWPANVPDPVHLDKPPFQVIGMVTAGVSSEQLIEST